MLERNEKKKLFQSVKISSVVLALLGPSSYNGSVGDLQSLKPDAHVGPLNRTRKTMTDIPESMNCLSQTICSDVGLCVWMNEVFPLMWAIIWPSWEVQAGLLWKIFSSNSNWRSIFKILYMQGKRELLSTGRKQKKTGIYRKREKKEYLQKWRDKKEREGEH